MCCFSDELQCLKVNHRSLGYKPLFYYCYLHEGHFYPIFLISPPAKKVNKELLNIDVLTSIALAFASLDRS